MAISFFSLRLPLTFFSQMAATSVLFLLLTLILPPSTTADPTITPEIASFLSAIADHLDIPLPATLFVPDHYDSYDYDTSISQTISLLQYHVVPELHSFGDLCSLQPLSRLPTLLLGKSIAVTNNSPSNYTLNQVLVTEPDIFLSSVFVIHRVASALDVSYRFGDSDGSSALGPSSPQPISGGDDGGVHSNGGGHSLLKIGKIVMAAIAIVLCMCLIILIGYCVVNKMHQNPRGVSKTVSCSSEVENE